MSRKKITTYHPIALGTFFNAVGRSNCGLHIAKKEHNHLTNKISQNLPAKWSTVAEIEDLMRIK